MFLGNIKIANVFHKDFSEILKELMFFHHPVYLLFTFYTINQIYLIIFHPAPLVTLIKWNIVCVTEVLEQPGSETHVHNVVMIRELRHTNVDKQSKLLADVDVTAPRGGVSSHYISMFYIEKCKQLEILDSSKATTLRM